MTPRRRSREDAEASAEWHRRVTAVGCRVCPARRERCDGPVRAHHVLYQQHIVRWVAAHAHAEALTADQAAALERRLLWDLRNGLAVCERAHRRHHSGARPIPLALVPLGAIRFASELGLAHRIEAAYPAADRGRLP